MRRFCFCIIFLLFLLVSSISATTYYVSTTGSDTNNDGIVDIYDVVYVASRIG